MKRKINIGIIGGGYVGLHTAIRISEMMSNANIEILEIDKDKIEKFEKGNSPINDIYMKEYIKNNDETMGRIKYRLTTDDYTEYDHIFISLSTNPVNDETSRLNTNVIKMFINNIREKTNTPITVRSTINIDDDSHLDEYNVNYWPEFLSQGVETRKNIDQSVNVISLKDDASELFFEELFRDKTVVKTSIKEAILIKVMHNSLDAHLISLTNLFANISHENGINFSNISIAVENLLKERPKVKKPGIGYGGSCYPKDSLSLVEITKKEQNKKLIIALNEFNKEQSYIFLQWEEIIRKAENIILLGLSFKGGTNDTTKTPTTSLRSWMNINNINYKVWEPMISKEYIMDSEIISESIESDIKKADLIILGSDWGEFNSLLTNYSGNVIDLKNFIESNNKMIIHKIGK